MYKNCRSCFCLASLPFFSYSVSFFLEVTPTSEKSLHKLKITCCTPQRQEKNAILATKYIKGCKIGSRHFLYPHTRRLAGTDAVDHCKFLVVLMFYTISLPKNKRAIGICYEITYVHQEVLINFFTICKVLY